MATRHGFVGRGYDTGNYTFKKLPLCRWHESSPRTTTLHIIRYLAGVYWLGFCP